MQSVRQDQTTSVPLARTRLAAASRVRRLSRFSAAVDALRRALGRIPEYHEEAERQARLLRRAARRVD